MELLDACRRTAGLLTLLLFSALLAAAPAQGQQAGVDRPAEARRLLRIASAALGEARRVAGAEAGAPLRSAFVGAELALEWVGRSLSDRDPVFYRDLARGSRAIGCLRIAGARSGIDDPAFRAALEDVSASYALLRGRFGWEAMRQSEGGPLSPGERERLAALQRAHRRLADRLERAADRARREGDDAAARQADRLAREAAGVASARPTLVAYLDASRLADELAGEWAGHRDRPERRLRVAWNAAADAVREIEEVADAVAEEETGFFFTADLGNAPAGGWSAAQVEEAPAAQPAAGGEADGWVDEGAEPEPEAEAGYEEAVPQAEQSEMLAEAEEVEPEAAIPEAEEPAALQEAEEPAEILAPAEEAALPEEAPAESSAPAEEPAAPAAEKGFAGEADPAAEAAMMIEDEPVDEFVSDEPIQEEDLAVEPFADDPAPIEPEAPPLHLG